MKLFNNGRNPAHKANLQQFERLMAMNSDIKFFQPRPDVAPWHVQAKINGYVLNMWPHLLKGNFDGERSVVGYENLQRLIGEARNATSELDDVIEGDEE